MALNVKKLAIIGAGSMGGNMALLFADKGSEVVIQDPSESSRKLVLDNAKLAGLDGKISTASNYQELCSGLSSPKVILFSLPHGSVPDAVLDGLEQYLERGDFIVDCSNEHWERTERRQGRMLARDVHYIGMGVSGGYQSARTGPSMCPGGAFDAIEKLLPFLRQAAAKDNNGNPCVAHIGAGGAGNFVKTIHNGIEHAMMSAQCEAWAIMRHGLAMSNDDIADIFAQWDAKGELSDNFLISIGIDICRQKVPRDESKHVLDLVKDKVVQDTDATEGTGYWTLEAAADLHVPHPTLAAAHSFRLGSGYSKARYDLSSTLEGPFAKPQRLSVRDLEALRRATYATFLGSYLQGLDIIQRASDANGWHINMGNVLAIWRGGCIIRAGYINDLLSPHFEKNNAADWRLIKPIVDELRKCYQSLKQVVVLATENDYVVPALSATLEWLKYSSIPQDLPTQFQEAQLDYFGKHMFDLRSDGPGEPVTGARHFEWKPPKGLESTWEQATKLT
ncbi:MAG: hypothetical protein Q9162_007952 [Coniocarpon cinnabarinum]